MLILHALKLCVCFSLYLIIPESALGMDKAGCYHRVYCHLSLMNFLGL